jgi:hypothetical protein
MTNTEDVAAANVHKETPIQDDDDDCDNASVLLRLVPPLRLLAGLGTMVSIRLEEACTTFDSTVAAVSKN